MTKSFKVNYTCKHCGGRTTAETGFGRWMRNNLRLDSGSGIVRTDCDHIICRYKTNTDGREFQLMMIVEVKEFGSEPDQSQRDILSFISQSLIIKGRNMHHAETIKSLRLKSIILGRNVLVRNFGVFLLQFEKTNPQDSRWIKWQRKIISEQTLTEILSFHRRPDHPSLLMDSFLRNRHRKIKQETLFGIRNDHTN